MVYSVCNTGLSVIGGGGGGRGGGKASLWWRPVPGESFRFRLRRKSCAKASGTDAGGESPEAEENGELV